MCIRHQDLVDIILLKSLYPLDSLASAVLAAEIVIAHPLDITELCNRDDHVLLLDQIFRIKIIHVYADLRPAVVPVFIGNNDQFLPDHSKKKVLIRKDRLQLFDRLHQSVILRLDLASFQTCQGTETHIDNRLRLHVVQAETLHQAFFGKLHRLGRPYDMDDFIDIVQGDQQSL